MSARRDGLGEKLHADRAGIRWIMHDAPKPAQWLVADKYVVSTKKSYAIVAMSRSRPFRVILRSVTPKRACLGARAHRSMPEWYECTAPRIERCCNDAG